MPSHLDASIAAATARAVGESGFHAYGLVPAEGEREHPLRRMLAEREAEPSSPGRTEEARTLDPERVEDCESVRNPSDELVVARIAWLVASALTSVVGEDQSDFAAQRLSEAGCLRDLEADRRSRCRREPAGLCPPHPRSTCGCRLVDSSQTACRAEHFRQFRRSERPR